MALVQKKLSKAKQLRLGAMLALVIGVTLMVAYYGIVRKGGPGPDAVPPPSSAEHMQESAGVPSKTGFEAAQELKAVPLFQRLRSFGIWPLPLEPKGHSQPFILLRE
ncbi:MAG: hypothetical protein HYS45_01890 [Parcubacteria group bacterium]|nr:hypothetical protein [Parcubacteria group bacterium]